MRYLPSMRTLVHEMSVSTPQFTKSGTEESLYDTSKKDERNKKKKNKKKKRKEKEEKSKEKEEAG